MARFKERAQLDPSQVQDRRGMGGGSIGRGTAIGGVGGGAGLIILIITLLLGGNPLNSGGGSNQAFDPQNNVTGSQLTECQTGADAEEQQDCRIVAYVNSIQEFWTDEF